MFTIAEGTPSTIPLQPLNQKLSIALAGVTYQLTVRWNAASQCWMLDIADDSGDDLLTGIPLVTGCDLLEQFEYVGIGGALVVQSTNDPTLVPNFSSLGSTGFLYFVTPPGS